MRWMVLVLAQAGCADGVGAGDRGGAIPGFPFASYERHCVDANGNGVFDPDGRREIGWTAGECWTDNPDGHAARGVYGRNWDIDCRFGDGVGSIVGGLVTKVVDNYNEGYGNQVCVTDVATDTEYCHNHLEAGTLTVTEADVGALEVSQGALIGGCGNSGVSIGSPGDHLDVFARASNGEYLELPDPSQWAPVATLSVPGATTHDGFFTEVELFGDSLLVAGKVWAQDGIKTFSVTVGDYESSSNPRVFTQVVGGGDPEEWFEETIDLGRTDLLSGTHGVGLWIEDDNEIAVKVAEDGPITYEAERCDSHAYTQCFDGDVFWFDSCGALEELSESCQGDYVCVEVSDERAECRQSAGNSAPGAPNLTTPSSTTVDENTDLTVQVGTDPDGDRVRVECYSSGSNYPGGGETYDSELGSGGRMVYPVFRWMEAGDKTIRCTSFDDSGFASDTRSETIHVESGLSVTPECNTYTSSAGYSCSGGVVMSICGEVTSSGYLTVRAQKTDGSEFGEGVYKVRVFDQGDSASDRCAEYNTVKESYSVSSSSSLTTLSFSSFNSQANPGDRKGYCVTKEDGGDGAYWCSGQLNLDY